MTRKLAEIMTRDTEPEMIPTTLYKTLIDAVRRENVFTNLLALRLGPGDIKGSSIDVVTTNRDSSAVHTIAEGQEVPIDLAEFSTFNVKPVKYGLRPVITKEMQEDNQWNIIQKNVEEAGHRMAEKLDDLIFTELNLGAALLFDDNGVARSAKSTTGGAAITISDITTAMAGLEVDNYTPTDIIVHTNVANDLRNIDTFVEADKSGVMNPTKKLIGTIFQMKVWVSNAVTTNYAYVIDRNHALLLSEKRPITIEKYDDVTRDMSGVVITARWKARYLRPDACYRIITS